MKLTLAILGTLLALAWAWRRLAAPSDTVSQAWQRDNDRRAWTRGQDGVKWNWERLKP